MTATDPFASHAALVQAAWMRHHRRNSFATRAITFQTIMGMDDVDWESFAVNHPKFCDYHDRTGWMTGETLLAWVQNGCCTPPPDPVREQPNNRLSRIANRQR